MPLRTHSRPDGMWSLKVIQMASALPAESRNDCPLLRCMADALVSIKEANNKEILDELGMLPCSNLTCHCRFVRKE